MQVQHFPDTGSVSPAKSVPQTFPKVTQKILGTNADMPAKFIREENLLKRALNMWALEKTGGSDAESHFISAGDNLFGQIRCHRPAENVFCFSTADDVRLG